MFHGDVSFLFQFESIRQPSYTCAGLTALWLLLEAVITSALHLINYVVVSYFYLSVSRLIINDVFCVVCRSNSNVFIYMRKGVYHSLFSCKSRNRNGNSNKPIVIILNHKYLHNHYYCHHHHHNLGQFGLVLLQGQEFRSSISWDLAQCQ